MEKPRPGFQSSVPVKITLQPLADPRINDRARIQNAIDWVGRQPLQKFTLRDGNTVIQTRGAVLLQAGIYRIQGALILNKSGVVLRGEGNGPSGTVLIAMGQFKHDFIHLNGLLDSSFQGTPEYLARYGGSKLMNPKDPYVIQDEHVAYVADKYIPVGTTRVPVKDISNFKVGAEVVVEHRPKPSWVHLLRMDHIPPRPDSPGRTMNWKPHQYTLRYVRKVMAIEKKPTGIPVTAPRTRRNQVKTRSQTTFQKSLQYLADTNETEIVQPLHTKGMESFEETKLKHLLAPGSMPIEAVAKIDNDVEDDDDDDDDDEEDDDEDEDTVSDDPLWVPGSLTLDIPLVMNMDPKYGTGVVYNFARETPIPSDVGVENLAMWSEYDPSNLEDERHGWFAVMIDHCENCWVTDVKATNFVSGIKAASGSKHVTIQDCEIHEPVSLRSEGGRWYMYMVQGQMVLVKRCFATDARHDFMTGAKTPGPNVFVDSEGIRANNDAGPHGESPADNRWTTGTLYDNIHSYDFNVRNRGWMGSGQGWAGAFHVVYRCSADVPVEFQSPPGATNWIIDYRGAIGEKSIEFRGDEATFLDPEPKDYGAISRSLYWSQLVARMGGSSDAAKVVENYVGVAGKNSYPSPLPRRFMTTNEITASQEEIEVDSTAKGQGIGEQGDILRLEVDITSATDIEKVLNSFDEDLTDEDLTHDIE
ncbi:hypothetical protein BGX26_009528 [Mortierella sp. AD094]|nr:hypothetical protein BGX26_009528 [Mortierella sp. AD094]